MTRYHVALAAPLSIDERLAEAAADETPRHFMVELGRRLGAVMHEPGRPETPGEGPRNAASLLLGTDAALRAMCYRIAQELSDGDLLFSISEEVALNVAAYTKAMGTAPTIVTYAHNISRPRMKALAWGTGLFGRIEHVYVLSEFENRPRGTVFERIYEQCDDRFFRPADEAPAPAERPLLVSVGLEKRDYVTLAVATDGQPYDVAISGWSADTKPDPKTLPATLPANMSRGFYPWTELRALYQRASIVVVPLRENSYAAGITTILEGMATRKPVIATRTAGLDGVLGVPDAVRWVPDADPNALRSAIADLLADPEERARRAEAGYRSIKTHHSKDARLEEMERAVRGLAARTA